MIHINKYCHNQPKKPEIHIDEPCRVNPCSQESVYDVMNHIENICLVGANDHTNFKCCSIYSCIRYSRFCILSKCGMEVDRKGISLPKEIQITRKSLCVWYTNKRTIHFKLHESVTTSWFRSYEIKSITYSSEITVGTSAFSCCILSSI